jgi:hypothetical protein
LAAVPYMRMLLRHRADAQVWSSGWTALPDMAPELCLDTAYRKAPVGVGVGEVPGDADADASGSRGVRDGQEEQARVPFHATLHAYQ